MALAAVLGCALDVLTDLRLCRWPGAAEPRWTVEEDMSTIAGRFDIDATTLPWVDEEITGFP